MSSHSRQATPCCSPTSLLDFGSLSLTTFICIYNSHRQLPPLKKWALKCIQLTSQNSHHQAASTEFISKENQERIVKFVFRLLATFWCLCHIQVPSLRKQASKHCVVYRVYGNVFLLQRENSIKSELQSDMAPINYSTGCSWLAFGSRHFR